jgi:parvulin-like peptidyl-prolyl isomerase
MVLLLRHSFSKLCGLGLMLLSAAVLLAGCHPAITDSKDPQFIVAENSDWQITRGQLDHEVDVYLQKHHMARTQIPADKILPLETSLLDNMVMRRVIIAQAERLPLKDVAKEDSDTYDHLKSNFANQGELEKRLQAAGLTIEGLKKRIHEETLIRRVLTTQIPQAPAPDDQEISDFYTQHPEYFNIPEKIQASRILIKFEANTTPDQKVAKKRAIDQARARVIKGEDFAKVAQEVSEDKYSASKGGDIGFFPIGQNEKPFDDMAVQTKIGTVSPVFETMVGYWFIKVTATQPGHVIPLAEGRDHITTYLKGEKELQQSKAYTAKLLADARVGYHIARTDLSAPSEQSDPPPPNIAGFSAPASALSPATPENKAGNSNTP